MSAPPLRRNRPRWRYRLTHRRWWSDGQGSGLWHEHIDHQPARHERRRQHPHCKPRAAVLPCSRAGYTRRAPASRLALAGILSLIEACAGDGGRRVRSALGILAHAETAPADGIPHAGLGQVHFERPEIQALAESPRHMLPSVPPEAGATPPASIFRKRRSS